MAHQYKQYKPFIPSRPILEKWQYSQEEILAFSKKIQIALINVSSLNAQFLLKNSQVAKLNSSRVVRVFVEPTLSLVKERCTF